ncbi:subtilisin-like protease [Auriculariales sp. MPI-PUGE-AT-0066]|nr:subtilisin-like protease [Auriculariales sp. MPI-PUGE-AT-0066]
MPSFTNIVVALAGASVASAVTPISSVRIKDSLSLHAGKYIVELEDAASTRSFPTRDIHAQLFEQLDRRGVEWETNTKFESPIFNAVSITLSNPDDIVALQALDGVKSVHPVKTYELPRTFNAHVLSGPSDPNLPKGSPDSTHVMTGVDKLHAKGIKGKGIKVGIIDTGVDYHHPSLGGGFGPGHLIAGGYDFVGDAYNGVNNTVLVPDADPLDQCAGHGTHVAGIVAMQPGNEFNVTGVAPEVNIYAYRIFGCEGSTDDEVIIAALLRAYNEGCDVISLSLGGASGWVTSPGSVVASRIAGKGKVVTIAAGNEGADGAWYTSSPGNGLDVISVGSVDNTEVFYQTLAVSGVEHPAVPYVTDTGFVPLNVTGELPIYATSTDLTIKNDGCEALPDSTPDLSGFATVIRRGTCNFTVKIANAVAKGAKLVIIANNGGVFGGVGFNSTTPTVMIDTTDGDFLVQQFVAKAAVKVSFPQTGGAVQLSSPTGGLSSEFSTFGPTNDGWFKPAVSAPGGQILATWPTTMGSWTVISGTSMATPHTAGVAALLLQAKGKTAATAKAMRTLLETTSTVIPADLTEGSPAHTLTQAGAGLVNAFNAYSFKTVLSTGELLLNDTANWKGSHSFTIKNTGKKAVKYSISHIPAGTALTIDTTTNLPVPYPLTQTSDAVGLKLSASSVTVQPGKTATIKATFTPPKNVNAKEYPVVSGHIKVQGNGEILKVSYLGTAAALKDIATIDGSAAFFGVRTPIILNAAGEDQPVGATYTLKDADAPTVLFRMAMGSPRIVFDLVSKNLHTKVTIQAPTSLVNPQTHKNFDDVPIVGRIGSFDWAPRDSIDPETGYQTVALPPTFENGTAIAPGEYRLLVRAQRIASDPKIEANYDVYMSNSFSVVAA